MITLPKAACALMLLSVMASCGTISIVSNSLQLSSDARVSLGEVVFDYSGFRQQDEEWQAQMREQESSCRAALEQAYTSKARELDLDAGAATVALRVTITDLNPGSRAARFWVGVGAGSLDATIDAGEAGGMVAKGAVTGNDTLVDVFADLGVAIAEQVAEARR